MMGRDWPAALVVGVALLLSASQSQDVCGGQDGRPGEVGVAGRNGWLGPKGEKGEPAAPVHAGPSVLDPGVLLRLKGERGTRGLPGASGLKGLSGELGPEGLPGLAGPPGPAGGAARRARSPSQAPHSAFSVVRTLSSYPNYNQPIIYQTVVVNKPGEDMDISTGRFTCRVPGLYYFVFHALSKVSMCISLKSEALQEHVGGVKDMGFCDHNTRRRHTQMLSGGVVLQLARGQRVWLEAFKDNPVQSDAQKADTQDKEIVFNGFLLF